MHTVVQITLDRAAVGIRGQDETLLCCVQLFDLDPQSIDFLFLPSVQFDRPPRPDCQELSVIATAASSGQHPLEREASLLRTGLRTP
jgi:hypothetical protein